MCLITGSRPAALLQCYLPKKKKKKKKKKNEALADNIKKKTEFELLHDVQLK